MTVLRLLRLAGIVLALLLISPGVSGTGYAQSPSQVSRIQGAIAGVDCDRSLLTLRSPGGQQDVFLATQETAVWARTERLTFCDLRQFMGSLAIVAFTQIGTQKVAGSINVLVLAVGGVVAGGGDHAGEGPGSSGSSSNGGHSKERPDH